MSNGKSNIEVIIVTGLSGAGRTQAVRCFEDLGYFCIDNMPAVLITQFIEIVQKEDSGISKICLGIDVRSQEFFPKLNDAIKDLKKKGIDTKIIFLEASNEILLRRFNTTKRKHPLHQDILTAINLERDMLRDLRSQATKIIDTTGLTSRQLWAMIIDLFMGVPKYKENLAISLVSFGFKYGSPQDADIVFDVRFLPSPFHIEPLRNLSGLDGMVKEYVLNAAPAKQFMKKFNDLLEFLTGHYIKEGKNYITLAIGSEEGRHRSPAIVHELVGALRTESRKVIEWHRDIERK